MFGGAYPVRMVVDQTWNDRAPLEIDHFGAGRSLFAHLRVFADGNNAAALDRHRLRDMKLVVDRDDLAIEQNKIRITGVSRHADA